MPQLEPLGLENDPMFAQSAEGKPVSRNRVCDCGRKYTQRLLSERFLNIVAMRGEKCLAAFEHQVPQGYVPVFCPSCERKDIGRWARIAEHRLQFPEDIA